MRQRINKEILYALDLLENKCYSKPLPLDVEIWYKLHPEFDPEDYLEHSPYRHTFSKSNQAHYKKEFIKKYQEMVTKQATEDELCVMCRHFYELGVTKVAIMQTMGKSRTWFVQRGVFPMSDYEKNTLRLSVKKSPSSLSERRKEKWPN